jgi:hypothetical protein
MIAHLHGPVRVCFGEGGLISEQGGLPKPAPSPELAGGQIFRGSGWARAGVFPGQDFGDGAIWRTSPTLSVLRCLGESDILIVIAATTQFEGRNGHDPTPIVIHQIMMIIWWITIVKCFSLSNQQNTSLFSLNLPAVSQPKKN